MIRFSTLALASLALAFNLQAQQDVLPCHANDIDQLLAGDPDAEQKRAQIVQVDAELEAFTQQWALENSGAERVEYTVPVVFHIIHNNGPENISDDQIFDAIRVINDDYHRLNADWVNVRPEFQDIVASVGITFALASKDPDGNCTKGITRTQSVLTNDGTQTMKDLIQWPRNQYLNIWVAASANGAAGYSMYPGSVQNNPTADGIVVLHNYVGSIGTSSSYHSRTLTHEIGHWINLRHCWGNSNTPADPANCDIDDNVSDTPNTIGWTNCVLSGASCGSPLDNVENYMEYSYCSKMFTEGQKTRMLAALNSGTSQRNQLWSASNLAATGVSGAPVLCAAEFTNTANIVCVGSTVTFNDASYHGVTSRSWDFPGGSPATSTDSDPVITYDQPGSYMVQLTVSDGNTTLTSTQNTQIIVMDNPGATPPVQEGFESLTNLNGPEWYSVNPDADNTFTVSGSAAYSGSKCSRLLNTANMDAEKDELLSRSVDMTQAAGITLSFRYAYARRNSTSDDVLSIYVSNNCGETWALRKIMRGTTTLPTAPITTGNFVPNGQAEWGYAELVNISEAYHVSNFRFKFEFVSDGGNNLYIDDINLNAGSVGVSEIVPTDDGFTLMPNPTSGSTQVLFELRKSSLVRLEVMDGLGRTVQRSDLGVRPAGEQRATLDAAELANGSYLVRITTNNGVRTARLVVQ